MAQSLALMLPAMNVDGRTELLGGMRAGAPAEVFEGVWSLAGSVLDPTDLRRGGRPPRPRGGGPMTVRTPVNPWSWSEGFGYEQANLVEGATRTLVCAGQTSVDADGAPVHLDDMGKQLAQALDNLEAVLAQAGMSLADVARLNFFTTDLDAFFGAYEVVMARLPAAGARPAGTLLEVSRLALPGLLVELEATAYA